MVIPDATLKFAYDRVVRGEITMNEQAAELGLLAEALRRKFRRRGWATLSEVRGWSMGRSKKRNQDPPIGEHPYIPVRIGEPCVVCDKVCEEGWWTASTSLP